MFAQGDYGPIANGAVPSGAPGILPCVWMSAGLVSFKLCDREGECEGCPFDRAMQGARRPEPPVSSRDISSLDIPSLDAGLKGGHLPARAGRRQPRKP